MGTTNYNLKKPLGTEYFSVEDQNGNMDLIDTALKGLADGKEPKIVTKKTAFNSDFATKIEAEAFTDNTKVMTPISTAQSIEKWVSTNYTDVSLLSANWTGSVAPYSYTLTLAGVKATGTEQTFLPQLSATTAQLEAIQGANLQDGGQALNQVTIKAYGEKPIINLPLRYKISGVK